MVERKSKGRFDKARDKVGDSMDRFDKAEDKVEGVLDKIREKVGG